jgi:hypothetical protein
MADSTIENIKEICSSLGILTMPPPERLTTKDRDTANESLKEMLKNTGLDKYLTLDMKT